MQDTLHFLGALIVHLGPLGVFLVCIIEELVVPIPSTLVQAGAGALILGGHTVSAFSIAKLIFFISIPGAIGVTIGSLALYGLAYYGGMVAIKKWGKYFFLRYERVEAARAHIATNPSTFRILILLRFLPLFPNTVITAGAGILRIPLKPYLISTFIGVFVRITYLATIGWLTGNAYDALFERFSVLGIIGALVLMLAFISAITWFVVRYVKRNA